jgi:hypothetical protein
MTNLEKFWTAIINLKSDVKLTVRGDEVTSQEDFNNKIEWFVRAENEKAVTTKTNPHAELTWDKVNTEMTRLQAEYDAQDYARKRKAEYPAIEELVVALYDTDDKAAIEAKRAEVKAKYPKS